MSGWGAVSHPVRRDVSRGLQTNLRPLIRQMLRDARVYPPQMENLILDDVLGALRKFPSLEPQLGNYQLRNSSTVRLLRLLGTIPISYEGAQYNVLVSVWITEFHPTRAPMVYVLPTENIVIVEGHKFVTQYGLVFHPYLHQWTTQSNLSDLLRNLANDFGHRPPVKAKPKVAEQKNMVVDKIKIQMVNETFEMVHTFDRLLGQWTKLNQHSNQILEVLSNLKRENMSSVQRIETLKAENKDLELWIANNQEPKQVEDLLKAGTRQHQQLIECVASNMAYEDILSSLDDGLEAGAVTLPEYLKEVERIARVQFFERALQRRIRLNLAEQERSTS